MSRKHSRLSSASLDNINVGIFVDEAGASTIENPPKRKKRNDTQAILLKKVQERKDLLFLEYQDIFKRKKEEDQAWQWLGSLGVPCHNTPIPITPHTKPHLQKGSLPNTDPLNDINLDTVYHAHDVTRSVISRYCDWTISDAVPTIDPKKVNSVFYTYRNNARNAAFVGTSPRPGYKERPTRSDPRHLIERCVMQVIRSAALYFEKPKLRIPLQWKELPLPKILTLPPLYNEMVDEMVASQGRAKRGGEGTFSREPSRPLDEIKEPHLMEVLKSCLDGDAPPSTVEQKKLEVFQKAFPVDSSVPRETAHENIQLAREIVDNLNRPLYLIIARRELAHKLGPCTDTGVVDFTDAEKVKRVDEHWGFGNILFNDEPAILAHQTANIALKWANETGSPPSATETGHEKDVGGLLNKLVTSEEVYVSDNGTLSLPGCLQMAGMRPQPDLASQAQKIDSCPRLAVVSPVVFAGECKTKRGLTPHTPAQLACALNGTLVLLVLMYLDLRATTEDPLPDWLFVYGIIYTGSGVIIRAHFPTYKYVGEESDTGTDDDDEPQTLELGRRAKRGKAEKNSDHDKGAGSSKGEIPKRQGEVPTLTMQRRQAVHHGVPRWIFRSVEVTRQYQFAFEGSEISKRIQLLAVLLMIRSHSFLLLEKFKAWAADSSTSEAFTEFLSVLNPI